MTNTTNILLEGNYNLSKLITRNNTTNVIDNPTLWFANLNELLGGFLITTFLYVFGFILFMIARKNGNISDSEAGSYAGLVVSFIGLFLFIIDIMALPGIKLLSWGHVVPIWVISGGFFVVNFVNKKF